MKETKDFVTWKKGVGGTKGQSGMCQKEMAKQEEVRMQMDGWSIVSIVLVVVGFFGGIWYEHK